MKTPKNTVYVYYYSGTDIGNGHFTERNTHRVVVCKKYITAFEELDRDCDYFEREYGAKVIWSWANDVSVDYATAMQVELEFPNGSRMTLHISPAVPH